MITQREARLRGKAQYLVTDHGYILGDPFEHDTNGLIGTSPGVARIITGTHTGTVRITLEIHRQPPVLETDPWDEVVEVSYHTPVGRSTVYNLDWDSGFPIATTSGRGWYRIRVHARKRDETRDLVAHDVEEHRVCIWPGPSQEEIAYKHTDKRGAALRKAKRDK
ncbi:MAG: hypothetical protein ACRDTQ_15600 [Micromonosporaceae bacterium]